MSVPIFTLPLSVDISLSSSGQGKGWSGVGPPGGPGAMGKAPSTGAAGPSSCSTSLENAELGSILLKYGVAKYAELFRNQEVCGAGYFRSIFFLFTEVLRKVLRKFAFS